MILLLRSLMFIRYVWCYVIINGFFYGSCGIVLFLCIINCGICEVKVGRLFNDIEKIVIVML